MASPIFTRTYDEDVSLGANASVTRTTDATFRDFEGLLKTAGSGEAVFENARRVENLASALSTHSITVKNGNDYQVVIDGGNGDTCVLSNAFTGTLTADGSNRIGFNSGTAKTATSSTLTLTITGTMTEVQVEDVTGHSNQNPADWVDFSVAHGAAVNGVEYFATENANTVTASGVVTEATGSAITADIRLLRHEAVTNLLTRSEEFENAAWSRVFIASVVADSVLAPTGEDTADDVSDTTDTDIHIIFQSATISSTDLHTGSVFLKDVDRGYAQVHIINVHSGTTRRYARVIDLSDGSLTQTYTSGSPTNTSTVVESFDNGIYRVSLSMDADDTGSALFYLVVCLSDSGTPSLSGAGYPAYTGDGSSIGVFGGQANVGGPKDYVKTVSAAATRNADDISYTLTTPQTEGMALIEWEPTVAQADDSNTGILSFSSSDSTTIMSRSNATTIAANDDTNTADVAPSWAADNLYFFATTWSSENGIRIGYVDVDGDGSWTWDTDSASYDGSWPSTSTLEVEGYGRIKRVIVYDSDEGISYIEDTYPKITLRAANSEHTHTSQEAVFDPGVEALAANSEHTHTSQSASIDVKVNLLAANSEHTHTSQTADIITAAEILAANAEHTHTVQGASLDVKVDLLAASSEHTHTSQVASVDVRVDVAAADAEHTHTSQGAGITTADEILAADSEHTQTSQSAALSVRTELLAAASEHAHTSELSPIITDDVYPAADSAHAHTSQGATLTGIRTTLNAGNAEHTHTSQKSDFTAVVQLSAANSEHSHTSQSTDILIPAALLVAANSQHTHESSAGALSDVQLDLLAANSEHIHTAALADFAPPPVFVPTYSRVLYMPVANRTYIVNK